MNYLQIYNKIIDHAKSRNSAKGGSLIVESHHIIPRHCGGSDLKENKVNLTLREHFLCHVLLAKIYKDTEFYAGMCRAVVAMSQRGAVSSKLYESIKTQHVNNLKKQIISDEQKNAISRANKGNKSRAGMKNSAEHNASLSRLGFKHSQETKDYWSKKRKGSTPWNKGVTGYKMPRKNNGVAHAV